MSIVMVGSTSGSITLQEPAVAGTTVLSLPATTGTLLTTATPFSNGQGPAFSAFIGSNQSLTNVWQKIQANTEEYDTANCYDTSNFRFTPNVAGYYQVNASVLQSSSTNRMLLGIYKNGTINKFGTDYTTGSTIGVLSTLIYMNGSTDYIEFWVFSGGSVTLNSGNPNSFFQAFLARAA